MDELCTVMALHTETCTVVRTDAELSESFEVKVGLHQGSVLSPLLFAAVMDVVSSEARSGLPSELLYAEDLVLMAPTMEQLGPLEMKGRLYASCVRSIMIYGSETRPLLVDVGLKFERAEMQMIRWMCWS